MTTDETNDPSAGTSASGASGSEVGASTREVSDAGNESGEAAAAATGSDADEQELLASYASFTAELDALPGAADFRELFRKYGQRHGFRTVGRWIAGRAPKPRTRGA
jgi:hypothetical protein